MNYIKYSFLGLIVASGLFAPSAFAADPFTRTLYFGLRNDPEVLKLQEFLTLEGVYSGPITGNFGSLTLASLKEFQQKEGLASDGHFGPLTRQKANAKSLKPIQAPEVTVPVDNSTSSLIITQQAATIRDLQFRIDTLLQEIIRLKQQLRNQQVLGAQTDKDEKINAVKKEYGLKINDIQGKILELKALQQNKTNIWENFRAGNSLDSINFIDTYYKRTVAGGIFEQFPYKGCTRVSNDISLFCAGIANTILEEKIKELDNQIPYLQNEMDRKILEIQ